MGRLGMILLTLLAGFLLYTSRVLAADHVVGGSMWSIPPSAGLYSAWAANRTFLVGDNLVFRFEMGSYDVVQVSRREYEDCTADDPFRTFRAGPAVIPLDTAGVRCLVCSVTAPLASSSMSRSRIHTNLLNISPSCIDWV